MSHRLAGKGKSQDSPGSIDNGVVCVCVIQASFKCFDLEI